MRRREDVNYDRELIGRSALNGSLATLPLVHVTASWPGKEIVRTGKLITHGCDVFQADLLYFFVLRPAYRSRYGTEESHQLSRFPAVFVLRSDAVESPRHVYPFDTGGAAKGAFSKRADPYVNLEDYAIAPSHAAAASFINWAFGSLDAYFEGRLRSDIQNDIMPKEGVAVGYVDVARMGVEGSNEHDKRASTVEVACSHNIDLACNLLLTIFPKQFLEGNLEFVAQIKAFGSDIEVYDWQPNRAPDEFQRDILKITRDWYRRKGIMPS